MSSPAIVTQDMNYAPATVMSDLDRALKLLAYKQEPFTKYWAYYDGNAPMVYTASRLQEIFGALDAIWRQNWARVVVDSVYHRMNLNGMTVVGQEETSKRLNDLWMSTEMDVDSDVVHLASLVCGESYVVAEKNEQFGIEAYYNDPRMACVYYDPEHPKRKVFAAKWWLTEDRFRRVNLYYEDRTEQFVSTAKEGLYKTEWRASSFQSANPARIVHAIPGIPVFHFRKDRRAIKSELLDVIEIQNAINKLLSDMMVSAEFGAMKQRFLVTNMENAGSFRATDAVWIIPAAAEGQEPTQIGEFGGSDLAKFIESMNKLISDLAIITGTPKYYIFGQTGVPSGEALHAMEAPLIAKCRNYIQSLEPIWKDLAAYLLRLDGKSDIQSDDIQTQFANPEISLPKTTAETRQLSVNAGIPLETTLKRDEGWTDEELAELEAQREAARKREVQQSAEIASARQGLMDAGAVSRE